MSKVETFLFEAVAITSEPDDEGEVSIGWILEGGIAALEGPTLLVALTEGHIGEDWYGSHFVHQADFDQVTAERDALQLLLNERDEQLHTLELSRRAHLDGGLTAERRVEELTGLLREVSISQEWSLSVDLQVRISDTIQKQCTSDGSADSDIPDFTPGNGNKARRRAAALSANKFSDANEPPCTFCFVRGCNGECSGDGAMGD